MKKSIFLLACLIGMVSCTDRKDVFDPNAEAEKKKEEYDKNFPATNIDPTQDWSTFTIVKASVTVNEDWGENYVVKIYTANPLDESAKALLLAKAEIKSGETFSADIEIPKALAVVWVARVDSHKRRLVKPAAIVDGKIISVFGTPENRAAISARSTIDVEPLPYSSIELQKFMNEGTDLSTHSVDNIAAAKGTYYVPAGKTLDWTWAADGDSQSSGFKTGDVKLIIAGTVNYTSPKSIGNGVQVIVAQGGHLNLSADMVFNNAAGMVVMPEAFVNGNSASITFANGTDGKTNYIAGTVNVATWNNNGGITYNCGKVDLKKMQGSSSGSTFINSGVLNITEYVGDENTSMQKIVNNCYLAFSGWVCNLCDLEMGASSYLTCSAKLKGEGGIWKLHEHSMIVAGELSLNNTNVIGPLGRDFALFRINNVSYINYSGTGVWDSDFVINKGYIINNIYLEYASLTGAGSKLSEVVNETVTKLTNQKKGNGNVSLAHYYQSPSHIPFGTCTEGNEPDEKGDDTDDDEENSAYYAFEDLGTVGDYDFNDVILKVSHPSGSTRATVELVAAGGTLATAVKYGDEVLWNEVHDAFGVELSTMVNTGRGNAAKEPEPQDITVPSNATFTDLKFAIVVTYSNGNSISKVESVPSRGEAPQYLCVPTTWKWPKESVRITQAYAQKGHSFEEWAQNDSQAKDWYNYPANDKVY